MPTERRSGQATPAPRPLLEVIVLGVDDALAAEAAGADRLEVVADIGVGGLTPDAAVVAAIAARCRLPAMVMARPHSRSFVYDDADMRQVREAVAMARDSGAHGIVFGALTPENAVAVAQLDQVARWCDGLALTFHRAFDAASDLDAAYDALERRADTVARVLTSGGAATAAAGIEALARLLARGGRVPLLVGSGVDAQTLPALHARLGARQYHVGSGARHGGRYDAGIDAAAVRAILSGLEHPAIPGLPDPSPGVDAP